MYLSPRKPRCIQLCRSVCCWRCLSKYITVAVGYEKSWLNSTCGTMHFLLKEKETCPWYIFQQKSHKVSAPNLNGKSQWRQYFWRVKLYVLCCLILIVASRLTYTYWNAGQSWSIQDHILVGGFVCLFACLFSICVDSFHPVTHVKKYNRVRFLFALSYCSVFIFTGDEKQNSQKVYK